MVAGGLAGGGGGSGSGSGNNIENSCDPECDEDFFNIYLHECISDSIEAGAFSQHEDADKPSLDMSSCSGGFVAGGLAVGGGGSGSGEVVESSCSDDETMCVTGVPKTREKLGDRLAKERAKHMKPQLG